MVHARTHIPVMSIVVPRHWATKHSRKPSVARFATKVMIGVLWMVSLLRSSCTGKSNVWELLNDALLGGIHLHLHEAIVLILAHHSCLHL